MAVVQSDDVRGLGLQLEQQKAHCADLEEQLARKDAILRAAREEHKLLSELHTVNQMTKRKLDVDVNRANRMPISQDSLDRIIALEDELKLIDKRKKDLDHESELVAASTARTVSAAEEMTDKIALIKDTTGWERYQYASRGYVSAENLFREHQKRLAKLEEEQQGMQKTTTKLTDHIEELSKQLEEAKDIEDRYHEAQALLKKRHADLVNVQDEIAQIKRITIRKEKLLDQKESSGVTDAQKLKQLEGDKRVLHTDLSRLKETSRNSEKSILAQDVKLRQLEGRLAAVSGFLVDKFVPESGEEEEGDREPVPIKQFTELHEELTQCRVNTAARDVELAACDERIELLENKAQILKSASISRTAAVIQSEQEMAKENEAIDERVADIEKDFMAEYNRLTKEQARLQQTLARLTRASQ